MYLDRGSQFFNSTRILHLLETVLNFKPKLTVSYSHQTNGLRELRDQDVKWKIQWSTPDGKAHRLLFFILPVHFPQKAGTHMITKVSHFLLIFGHAPRIFLPKQKDVYGDTEDTVKERRGEGEESPSRLMEHITSTLFKAREKAVLNTTKAQVG